MSWIRKIVQAVAEMNKDLNLIHRTVDDSMFSIQECSLIFIGFGYRLYNFADSGCC